MLSFMKPRANALARVKKIERPFDYAALFFARRACPKKASIYFLIPGAVGTARPTFQFPFECPGTGRAACSQAAARKFRVSFLRRVGDNALYLSIPVRMLRGR